MAITSLLNLGGNTVYTPPKEVRPTDINPAVRSTGTAPSSDRVSQESGIYYLPGLMNVTAASNEVMNRFTQQVQKQEALHASNFSRWDSQRDMLLNVQSMFGTEEGTGQQDTISRFFDGWNSLAQNPESEAARQELLEGTDAMLQMLRGQREALANASQKLTESVQESLVALNEKLQALTEVNKKLAAPDAGTERSQLIKQRNDLVRAIAEKVDIETSVQGYDQIQLSTRSGLILVEGSKASLLQLSEPSVTAHLAPASTFDGAVEFSGTSSREITLEVVQGGAVGTGDVTVRASLDGKRSWLTDSSGNELRFSVAENGSTTSIQGVEIQFHSNAGMLAAGDSFTIIPKQHLTGFTPNGRVNLTPQTFFDGSDNELRLTGGAIAGQLQLRDNKLGSYAEKLDGLAATIIREVNALHAQGASPVVMQEAAASNAVENPNLPLADNRAGLPFRESVSAGKMTLFVTSTETGKTAPTTAFGAVDFSGVAPYTRDFDPAVHSLVDVRDALNNSLGQFGNATIEDNLLHITGAENQALAFGEDTTGLFSALGVNAFFTGTTASNIAVNEKVSNNPATINTGVVNNAGAVSSQSTETAKAIANLKDAQFNFTVPGEVTKNASAREYYSALSTQAKDDTAAALYQAQFNETLLLDLSRQNATMSGNNFDAEISEMTKFQHSYKAAAKLITSAEDMMQAISGMPN